MKVISVRAFTAVDPIDVSEVTAGEKKRKQMRIQIIRDFLSWAYFKEYDRWGYANYDERNTVLRHITQTKMLTALSVVTNSLFYVAFLRGIYNYRTRELINMRNVPFVAKFALSTSVSFYVSYQLWKDDIYNPELYKLALKYRPEYDASSVDTQTQTAVTD